MKLPLLPVQKLPPLCPKPIDAARIQCYTCVGYPLVAVRCYKEVTDGFRCLFFRFVPAGQFHPIQTRI